MKNVCKKSLLAESNNYCRGSNLILGLILTINSWTVQAEIITGQGISESEKISLNTALYDLEINLLDKIPFYPSNSHNISHIRPLDLPPLIDITIETKKQGDNFLSLAKINRNKLIKTANSESTNLNKKIKLLLSKIKSLPKELTKHKTINTILGSINDLQHYQTIINPHNENERKISNIENYLHIELINTLKQHNSMAAALKSLSRELKLKKETSLFIFTPVFSKEKKTNNIGINIKEILQNTINTSSYTANIMHANNRLTGKFYIKNNKVLLIYHFQDIYHRTLKTASVLFTTDKNTSLKADTIDNKLTEELYRGIVRIDMKSQPTNTYNKIKKPYNNFRIDIRTEQGNQNLYYRTGSTGSLFIKMTSPGYFYIIGHVSKTGLRHSYLLQLSNKRGNNRFIYHVNKSNVHKWIKLGDFDINPPLGIEALQAIASTDSVSPLLPEYRYDMSSDLYLTGNDPEKNIIATRGIVRIQMGKPQADNKITKGKTLYAESVLHFKTLGK